ncbi:MAG: hypothetical protein IKZ97_02555, partial [Butyrivibrio sp.]|nr:hypothetical protein [Butyrivibrio sp.]
SKKRSSEDLLMEWNDICSEMRGDQGLKKLWQNYCDNNSFSRGASYDAVLNTVSEIGRKIS